MDKLVDFFGIRWIEPAMLHPFIPSELEARTYLWLKNTNAIKNMKSTTPNQYTYRLQHILGILRLLQNYTLVIDNGILAYCLFKEGNVYFVLDPHTIDKSQVKRQIDDISDFLGRVDCWMILALK